MEVSVLKNETIKIWETVRKETLKYWNYITHYERKAVEELEKIEKTDDIDFLKESMKRGKKVLEDIKHDHSS